MSLASDIEAIGDELVAAFHERRMAASLDYLLLRLESAAIRAAALEAGRSAATTVFVAGEDIPRGRFLTTSPWPRPASQPPAAGNVYAFPARTEPRR